MSPANPAMISREDVAEVHAHVLEHSALFTNGTLPQKVGREPLNRRTAILSAGSAFCASLLFDAIAYSTWESPLLNRAVQAIDDLMLRANGVRLNKLEKAGLSNALRDYERMSLESIGRERTLGLALGLISAVGLSQLSDFMCARFDQIEEIRRSLSSYASKSETDPSAVLARYRLELLAAVQREQLDGANSRAYYYTGEAVKAYFWGLLALGGSTVLDGLSALQRELALLHRCIDHHLPGRQDLLRLTENHLLRNYLLHAHTIQSFQSWVVPNIAVVRDLIDAHSNPASQAVANTVRARREELRTHLKHSSPQSRET